LFGYSYGLKKWILDKFVFVCENYDIDCSVGQEYLDSYKFSSFRDAYEITTGDVEELESTKSISTDTEITTTTTATATTTSETSDNKTINDDNLNDENKDESNSANQIHINSLLIILLMNVVVFML